MQMPKYVAIPREALDKAAMETAASAKVPVMLDGATDDTMAIVMAQGRGMVACKVIGWDDVLFEKRPQNGHTVVVEDVDHLSRK